MSLQTLSRISGRSLSTFRQKPGGVIALAALYFFSSAATFLWVYMPAQMANIGWTGAQIGTFFLVMTLSQALGTPLWARGSMRSARGGAPLVRFQFAIAVALFASLAFASSYGVGLLLAILLGLTIKASPPLIDTMAVDVVGVGHFGRIRSFGTAGFGLIALIFAGLGVVANHESLASVAPWVMLGLTALCLPAARRLPAGREINAQSKEEETLPPGTKPALKRLLKSPVALLLFPVAALFVATHAPYSIFLVALSEERGFAAGLPGLAVFIGVAGELIAFASAPRLLKRWGPERLLIAVVLITGLRWILTGLTTSPFVFIALQVLHGLSFAVFFLTMLAILYREWGPQVGATNQALLHLVVFTGGGALGTFVSGILIDMSSAAALFQQAGIASLALLPALLLALQSLKSAPKAHEIRPLSCSLPGCSQSRQVAWSPRRAQMALAQAQRQRRRGWRPR